MAEPTSPSTRRPTSSTNPTSPGSGRRQQSSGESTTTNIDTADVFRQGFPNPLRPLPQQNFIVEPEDAKRIQWWKGAKQTILTYLEARGVKWGSVSLANRRNPRDEADELDLTILISAQHDTSSDSWYLSLQDIFTYLQENDLSYIRVEIIDWEFSRAPGNFIVEPSHPLVSAWSTIRNRIIGTLAVRRGTHEIPEENPITILITTPDPSGIRPLLNPILSICAKAGFLLQAEVFEESSLFGISAFADAIPMGSSISQRSIQGRSATIGGAIILSKNNSHVRVGVTNFHVFWSKDTPKKFADNGLRPLESKVDVRAVVPSNQDAKFLLSILQKQLESDMKEPLAGARERWEFLDEERDDKNIQRLEANEQIFLRDIHRVQSYTRDAGSLWACSGFRVHPQTNFGLDWALIQLPDHRTTPNLLPTTTEVGALASDTPYYPPTSLKLELWSPERVCGGERVYKRGRTTGLTCGTFNAIEPAVNLSGKICSAWEIMGIVKHDFCRVGDSGSFVIDSHGKWCALLFAAPYNSFSGDGHVLPVSDLIADIERLTGGTVSLP